MMILTLLSHNKKPSRLNSRYLLRNLPQRAVCCVTSKYQAYQAFWGSAITWRGVRKRSLANLVEFASKAKQSRELCHPPSITFPCLTVIHHIKSKRRAISFSSISPSLIINIASPKRLLLPALQQVAPLLNAVKGCGTVGRTRQIASQRYSGT